MSLTEKWVLYAFSSADVTPPNLVKGEVFGPHRGLGFGGLQLGVLSQKDADAHKAVRITKLTELDEFPFQNAPSVDRQWTLYAFVPDTYTRQNLPPGMLVGPVLGANQGQGLGGLQLGVMAKEDAKNENLARLRKIIDLNTPPPWAKNSAELTA